MKWLVRQVFVLMADPRPRGLTFRICGVEFPARCEDCRHLVDGGCEVKRVFRGGGPECPWFVRRFTLEELRKVLKVCEERRREEWWEAATTGFPSSPRGRKCYVDGWFERRILTRDWDKRASGRVRRG